jgi:predicted peptidase
MGTRAFISFYMSALIMVLGANIIFGLALIFSDAGKRYGLKLTGIYSSLAGMVLLATAVWYINSTEDQKLLTLEQVYKWTSLAGWIGPFLLMINFLSEQKQQRLNDQDSVPSQQMEGLMTFIRAIAMVAMLFFALKLTGETVSRISWERNAERKEKEWEKVWAARTFVGSDGDTLKYQLIEPTDFDPTKKYPMVVCLPYGGGVEGSPPAKLLLTETNRKKYPSFLFVPFCQKGSGWGGIPNYPTKDTLVFESIEALESEYKEIDVDRIYVTGVSRGGYGSWHFISLRPDMFAAAIPVCGGGDPNLAANIVDVDIWAFHGEDDINVPVSGSRDMIEAIKKSGGNPKYTEFEGSGHDIWGYVTKTPGVLEWLFEQKRD